MSDSSLVPALAESAAGEWLMILSLVFGGCCSNVWALEAVLKDNPSSAHKAKLALMAGTFLTFAQFLFVAIQNVGSQLYLPPGDGPRLPRWRRNKVPMKRWMVQVVLFLSVSLMNNLAFDMKIPMTVHIIFRSGGLCVSMLTGYFMAGRRYSIGQVVAGVIITTGIVLATLSAPRRSRAPSTPRLSSIDSEGALSDAAQYAAGIALLGTALFVSAWLGLWQEQTYRQYGKQWREALFYCHFLSLPFFLPFAPGLSSTFSSYAASPPLAMFTLPLPDMSVSMGHVRAGLADHIVTWHLVALPTALFALAVNVVTQGLCIRGVNRLTSRVSSTTVNLILTLRKAASLAISVWYYGSGVSNGLVVGGAMVLGGTVIYSLAPAPHDASKTAAVEPGKTGGAGALDMAADPAPADTVGTDEVAGEELVQGGGDAKAGTAAGELRRRQRAAAPEL